MSDDCSQDKQSSEEFTMDSREITQPALRQTYGLTSCMEIWAKLQREYGRFLEARNDRANLSDHAINFAVTAWHICDWCWKLYFERDRQLCEAHGIHSLGDLQKYLRKVFPEITYLEVIASAAKHGGEAWRLPHRPDFETVLDAGDTSIGSWGRLEDVHTLAAPHGWDAVLNTPEGLVLTIKVYRKALYVWLDLLDRFGITAAEGHVRLGRGTTPWPAVNGGEAGSRV